MYLWTGIPSAPPPRWLRRGSIITVGLLAIGFVAASWTRQTPACATGSNSAGEAGSDVTGSSSKLSVTPGPDDPEPLIDPNDIVSGGPTPDGIPPLDDPKFEPVGTVDWLSSKEPVVALETCGEARAYPLQVMTWHEIVNDTIGGEPVTVTFCPLCNTAYAYVRPKVGGELTTFGTSGKLYHSNLVMYDRATESLWPQALGQAVIGPLTGEVLERRPAQIVSWERFEMEYPDGEVLSRNTGFNRRYGQNPYPGYDSIDRPPFRFRGEVDGRLPAVERILGVEMADRVVAFPYSRLQDLGDGDVSAANETIAGNPIIVIWMSGTVSALDDAEITESRDVGSAAAFSSRVGDRALTFEAKDGLVRDVETGSTWNMFGRSTAGPLEGEALRPLDHHDSFWFDWAAFHPDTEVWSVEEG